MRHKKAFRKLGRNPSHRRALLRNMATSLVLHDQIETTLPKAKELKRVADKLITLGKTDSLHRRRQAMTYLTAINREAEGNAQKWTAVHKLFTELAPRFSERNGGYTRVIRTRKRDGDKAQMAVIQFVEETLETKAPKRRRRRVSKSEESAATPAEAAAE
jgi:large subunit ribosomal protein L17